jgi:hypothetical protein
MSVPVSLDKSFVIGLDDRGQAHDQELVSYVFVDLEQAEVSVIWKALMLQAHEVDTSSSNRVVRCDSE